MYRARRGRRCGLRAAARCGLTARAAGRRPLPPLDWASCACAARDSASLPSASPACGRPSPAAPGGVPPAAPRTLRWPAALAPLTVAVAAGRGPGPRGGLAFRAIAGLGVATAIVLVQTLAQPRSGSSWTRPPDAPSWPEAAYPWALAILGTSVFAGLGMGPAPLGAGSGRPGQFGAAIALGIGLAAVCGTLMAGATIATTWPPRPTGGPAPATAADPTLVPPLCDAPLGGGVTADLTLDLAGTVDGRSLGLTRTPAARSGADFPSRLAEVTSTTDVGLHGAAEWWRAAGGSASPTPAGSRSPRASRRVSRSRPARSSRPPSTRTRTAAEDLRLVYVEGARARRCRVAVDDGRASAPRSPVSDGWCDPRPGDWRGEIDAWVFANGSRRAVRRTGGPVRSPWEPSGRLHGDPDGDARRRRDHRPPTN